MSKPKIYLETTMFSYYYEDRTTGLYPKYKEQVRRIFGLIKAGEYDPYSSSFTIDEINKEVNETKRMRMINLITEYDITILNSSDNVEKLSERYIEEHVLSSRHITDIHHIAIAVISKLDFMVSLNFKHISKPWTIEHVRRINVRESYKAIGIYKPREVLKFHEDEK
jgi:hypothetical protein